MDQPARQAALEDCRQSIGDYQAGLIDDSALAEQIARVCDALPAGLGQAAFTTSFLEGVRSTVEEQLSDFVATTPTAIQPARRRP